MDDLHGREPVAQDGYETVADLADFGWHCISHHAKMQIPVQVKVPVEILAHQRLTRIARIEELIKEAGDLRRVVRRVEIRRRRRVVDPLALVVWSTMGPVGEENGGALLLRIRLPPYQELSLLFR
jgi:hypothetical protein